MNYESWYQTQASFKYLSMKVECYGCHSCANIGTIKMVQTVGLYTECRGAFSYVNTINIKDLPSVISYIQNGVLSNELFSGTFISLIDMFEVLQYIQLNYHVIKTLSIIIIDYSLTCGDFKSCSEITIHIIGTNNEINIDCNKYVATRDLKMYHKCQLQEH